MTVRITLPRSIAERARREAEKQGLSLEEYIVELLTQGLDPKDRAVEYAEAAELLLERAREELRKGDARQAAEKTWGAAALTVKAYAYWRDGKRLASHGEMWEYVRRMAQEMGKWVKNAWYAASTMHICFYEEWCNSEDVEDALEHAEKLVKEVEARIGR